MVYTGRNKYIIKPPDFLVILYFIVLSTLIIVCRKNVTNWEIYIFWHVIIILIFITINIFIIEKNPYYKAFKDWYIIFCFIFMYIELGKLVPLVIQDYQDPVFIKIDHFIFQNPPSIYFYRIFNNKIISEVMHIGYFSYFFLIPTMGLLLYLKKKYEEFDMFVFSISLTYITCYLFFVIYPVAGPRFFLPGADMLEVKGLLYTDIIHNIISNSAIKGAAFPSSHVAIATVVLFTAWKFERKSFWVYLYFVSTLTLGTVYGRYHYVIDSIAGVFYGYFCYKIAPVIM
ncbi:hypothetical protein DRQ09_06500, partial [candidate division KSB1 bacterium]